jgi:O-antigen/teichoic acid export membrane protein
MNELLKQAFGVLFARTFVRVAQFIAFLLLARFMSPSDFGWFGIITSAITLASLIGTLGLRQSVAYEIGKKTMTDGEGTATVLVAWPVLAAASTIIVYSLYGQQLPSLSSIEAAILIAIGVGSSMLIMLLQGTFLGRGQVNSFNLTETLPRVFLAVLAVLLTLTASVSLSMALWAQVASFLIVAPVALVIALRGGSGLRPRPDRIPAMTRYGLAFALNLFLITLSTRISIFVIESHSGAADAGQFFAASRVNEIFLDAATAFGLVLFSHSVREADGESRAARNARIACWVFWSFSLLAVGIAIFAPTILRVMLGAEYADAGLALQILAAGLGPAAANKVIYPSIAGKGRPLFGTPIIVIGLAVNLVAAVLLVPRLGASGGALALVLGQYVMFIGYATAYRIMGVPMRLVLLPQWSDLTMVAGSVRSVLRGKLPKPQKSGPLQ